MTADYHVNLITPSEVVKVLAEITFYWIVQSEETTKRPEFQCQRVFYVIHSPSTFPLHYTPLFDLYLNYYNNFFF